MSSTLNKVGLSKYSGYVTDAQNTAASISSGYENAVGSYSEAAGSYNEAADSYNTAADSYESAISSYNETIDSYEETIADYEALISQYQQQIAELQNGAVAAQSAETAGSESQTVEELKKKNAALTEQNQALTGLVTNVRTQLGTADVILNGTTDTEGKKQGGLQSGMDTLKASIEAMKDTLINGGEVDGEKVQGLNDIVDAIGEETDITSKQTFMYGLNMLINGSQRSVRYYGISAGRWIRFK